MKKFLAVLMIAALLASVGVLCASAEELSADVYVTIADKDGKLALAAQKVTVTDIDGDEAITLNDALYAAHEQYYDGGAAEGYATETGQWGLGLAKLWGTANGGSYGYYVNNASAWSMTDPVKTGDYVAAFVYTDLVAWSDKYSYFDRFSEDVQAGEITLTLSKIEYDENWNVVAVPAEGAVITVDGAATDVKTDAEGKAVIALDTNGTYVISATSEDEILVPPVFVAAVSGGIEPETEPGETVALPESGTVSPAADSSTDSTQAPTQNETQQATSAATPDSSSQTTANGNNVNAVQTGSQGYMLLILAAALTAAAAVVFAKTKKTDEE